MPTKPLTPTPSFLHVATEGEAVPALSDVPTTSGRAASLHKSPSEALNGKKGNAPLRPSSQTLPGKF